MLSHFCKLWYAEVMVLCLKDGVFSATNHETVQNAICVKFYIFFDMQSQGELKKAPGLPICRF